MRRRTVYLSGLPRSGSTLLSNLLGMHPQVRATATSPLSSLIETLRSAWSEDPALRGQLDTDFPGTYARLLRAARAFMSAWSEDAERPVTADKSRGWLFMVETLALLDPDFRMIVCLRDLRDVYASVERQHRRTLLLGFPDRMEANLVEVRAAQLFAPTGLIGAPLRALRNLGDLPDLSARVRFWRFESFLADPATEMRRLFDWLELDPVEPDFQQIRQSTQETDSYYHFKYPHRVSPSLTPPPSFKEEPLSPRILAAIVARFGWYYRAFYGPDGFRPEAAREGPALEEVGGGFAPDEG